MPTAVITGTTSGIGRALAELMAESGWRVIGTSRDPSTGTPASWPGDVTIEALDLGCPGCGAEFAGRVLRKHGCPDVVVNNAGTLQFGPIETSSAEEIQRYFQINVFEQIELAYGFVPEMRLRGSGTIVNVTSLGGRMTFPFFSIYNASKHALEGFSEGMWHELKEFGIRVIAIEPGFVETAIWGKALPESPEELDVPSSYEKRMRRMLEFEASISNRTPPEEAARDILSAIDDGSDRLRYPVGAYARPILTARRVLGDTFMLRFFHKRWFAE